MSSGRPGLLRRGDTVLLPSQMINLQNKFSTPSPVPLAGLNTSHYEACALCPHTETLGGQVYVYASASLALRSKLFTFAGVQHFIPEPSLSLVLVTH